MEIEEFYALGKEYKTKVNKQILDSIIESELEKRDDLSESKKNCIRCICRDKLSDFSEDFNVVYYIRRINADRLKTFEELAFKIDLGDGWGKSYYYIDFDNKVVVF